MWWAGHVARVTENRNACSIFGGEPGLGVPGRVWELKSKITTEPKQIG